jgi:hypothetical protein
MDHQLRQQQQQQQQNFKNIPIKPIKPIRPIKIIKIIILFILTILIADSFQTQGRTHLPASTMLLKNRNLSNTAAKQSANH